MIRNLAEEDIGKVVDLWNVCLPCDRIEEERLWGLCRNVNYDPAGAFVAEESGRIVGFVLAIVRKVPLVGVGLSEDTGWILALGVHPECVGQRIGRHLLEVALTFLRSLGRRVVRVSAFPEYYFFPGIDERYREILAVFEAVGFERVAEPVDMVKSLRDFEVPEWVMRTERSLGEEGMAFGPCEERHYERFDWFMKSHFPGTWYLRARRYMDERGDPKLVFLCVQEEEVIGFVRLGVKGRRGSIDSIGVWEDLRGRGIGSVLLFKALEEMFRRGACECFIGYTGAIRFYEKAGATMVRRYIQMQKLLSTG